MTLECYIGECESVEACDSCSFGYLEAEFFQEEVAVKDGRALSVHNIRKESTFYS